MSNQDAKPLISPSKYAEIDATASRAAMAIAHEIVSMLRHHGYINAESPTSAKLIAELLRDNNEDDAYHCHDWIGEALSRREECAALIHKLGIAETQPTFEGAELEKEVRSLQHECSVLMVQRDTYKRRVQHYEAMNQPKATPPQCIVYYPDHTGVYVINTADLEHETKSIRGIEDSDTLFDDIVDDVAVVMEVGRRLEVCTTTQFKPIGEEA